MSRQKSETKYLISIVPTPVADTNILQRRVRAGDQPVPIAHMAYDSVKAGQLQAMRVNVEYQDQNGRWHRYQKLHNAQDAFRVASRRAQSTGRRHRIIDENQNPVDIIQP